MRNYYYLSSKDLQEINGKIAFDEEFVQVKGCPGFFISSYGRLISKRQLTTKVCRTAVYKGYEHYHTYCKRYGKYKSYDLKIHRLVAENFLPIPTWIRAEDLHRLVAHHDIKVSRDRRIKNVNCVNNLIWLPDWVHIVLHKHEYIEVYVNGKYCKYGFINACKRLGINPYDLCEVLKNETQVKTDYRYYSATIERDNGSSIVVDVRELIK